MAGSGPPRASFSGGQQPVQNASEALADVILRKRLKQTETGLAKAEKRFRRLNSRVSQISPYVSTDLITVKAADESVSNTTLQYDDELIVSVRVGVYKFYAMLFVDAAGALEGFKAAVNGTSTLSYMKAEITLYDDVTNTMVAFDRVTALGSSVGAGLSLGSAFCTIEGVASFSAGGTFGIQWAQFGGAGASATTVQKGSFIEWRQA